jgi:hypothetical protein
VTVSTIRKVVLCALLSCGSLALAQDSPPSPTAPDPQDAEGGRVLGLIPDNKIVPSTNLATEEPLTVGGKFMLAFKDTIDPFTFVLAGFYSGVAQWQNDYPSFGEGASGYGKRFGAAYADQAIGNYLTEAIIPSLLHEDPRYFRKGSGRKRTRLVYALSRTIITRKDNGRSSFNYSEVVGNGIAAGIANLYYPASQRSVGEAGEKLGIQVISDSAFNVLLEFWPDMKRLVFKR